MTDAIRDQNNEPSKLGVLFSDGVTLVPIKRNASNGGMAVNTTDTVDAAILALYNNGKGIPRDSNGVPAWSAQSSTDSTVEYPIFVDADGAVLVDL